MSNVSGREADAVDSRLYGIPAGLLECQCEENVADLAATFSESTRFAVSFLNN
ncbi:hypothetical protein L7750_18550 [Xenorhabdus bovienii]|uniref:hypothetical protein n=1 Tax=Xenorhabdus bovienii TaxID=40576 RepID=UPI001EDCD37B|nr:hypothetical protein [Xenorhabdus bovienii]MCG3472301.1 hypothetical protein [Xenorhabdus bovienii]